MGIIANLSVSVSAETSKFAKGMKDASTTLAEFTQKANQSSGQMGVFGSALHGITHNSREGRIAAAQMGQAFTGAGHAIGGIAQAFLVMGPVAGGVIAAFEVFNHLTEHMKKVSEEDAKALEQRMKAAEKYRDELQRVNEIMNKSAVGGGFSTNTEAEIKSLNNDLKELGKEYDELSKKGASAYEFDKIDKQRDKIVALRNDMTDLWSKQQLVNKAKDDFENESFDAKISTHGQTEDIKLEKELEVSERYAHRLADTLKSGVLGSGEAYAIVLKESHAEQLKILELSDKITANQERLAKEQERVTKEADKKIEEQSKAADEAYHKQLAAAERLKAIDPLEKFREDMEKVVELWSEGFLDDKIINMQLRKAEDEFVAASKKLPGGDSTGGGSFKQVDLTHMNLQAMALQNKKQEINSVQLEKTNAILEQINTKFGVTNLPATVGP